MNGTTQARPSITFASFDAEQVQAAVAAGYDVVIGVTVPEAPAVPLSAPALRAEKPKFAIGDMRAKRLDRAQAAKYPSSGMTSDQRSALALELDPTGKHGYTTRQWNKACREFIAAGRHI